MPYINIWERDDTGNQYTGEETIVFVPGVEILTSPFTTIGGEEASLDENNCYLIAPINGDQDRLFNNMPKALEDSEYIKKLLEAGLWVLYRGFGEFDASTSLEVDFLLDKNAYNIKFLTSGGIEMFQAESSDSDEDLETSIIVETNLAKSLSTIAYKRGDCCVIGSLNANITSTGSVLGSIKNSLDESLANFIIEDVNLGDIDLGKYIALFSSKMTKDNINTFPDLAYLFAYGQAIKNKDTWEALANKERGSVDYFSASNNLDATVSKYDLDNLVMNVPGRSFNGIIRLNPQMNEVGVIWGDRTLLYNNNPKDLKATSFLSIRNIISDIAKMAYQSAILATFETNNEVTWTNFKGRIIKLLDQMVAGYVLSNYEIIRKKSNNRAEIKCEIHIAPYGPVEDFDIGIILTNANAEIAVE